MTTMTLLIVLPLILILLLLACVVIKMLYSAMSEGLVFFLIVLVLFFKTPFDRMGSLFSDHDTTTIKVCKVVTVLMLIGVLISLFTFHK